MREVGSKSFLITNNFDNVNNFFDYLLYNSLLNSTGRSFGFDFFKYYINNVKKSWTFHNFGKFSSCIPHLGPILQYLTTHPGAWKAIFVQIFCKHVLKYFWKNIRRRKKFGSQSPKLIFLNLSTKISSNKISTNYQLSSL